ncbi:MAG: phosphatase PAP2 family protein [Nakamurella sp.]
MVASHRTSPLPRIEVRSGIEGRTGAAGRPSAALWVTGALVATALLLWLAVTVAGHPGPLGIDVGVLDGFLRVRTSAVTVAAKVIAVLTDPAATAGVVVAAALWLLLRSKDRAGAVFLICSSVATAVLLEAAKLMVGRPRPPIALQLMPESNNSFPSGHVTGVVAVFGALALVAVVRGVRRSLVVACWATLVVVVVLDRLYLGVHWFSDIVGALLLGTAILLAAAAVAHRVLAPGQPAELLRGNGLDR